MAIDRDSSHSPPIHLIIRFSASISDLTIPVTSPQTTNPSTLSILIRPQLPADLSTCSLRYIYAGALLPPATTLSNGLRLHQKNITQYQKFYLHCSISTTTHLTLEELEAEARAAKIEVSSLPHSPKATSLAHSAPVQPAEPQGFDRLLTAGFTPAEVASLRSQFLAIQSHVHTPDSMPTGAALRALEERWLDSGGPGGGNGDGGDSDRMDEDDGTFVGGGSLALEDMLWGNLMGFLWALPAITWLVREEGLWTRRRQIGVLTGALLNITFCLLCKGSSG
ncbi:uncharacterized protein KY384_004430 [Bacidia gigantensis]|uniref:uncharacterized protein n=1 Tax=Bacidia gigantensis TaxID=2732470 RepID=UPI001D050D75|nr:uncharacterized protein KY384_004430 [Bacidia gigantensis]KAG8531073.1 hypothetical protein KY384_004430 [Bacidia gigantensis]